MDKIDADEKKKMFDLMKDRELGGNMDWMYRGEKNDTEDYLLGKSVDKMITGEQSAGENTGGVGSLISERIKANVALDMQAKMREDPLFAIRRKEEDARKRLLENPVKMKQLQKLVEQQKSRSQTKKDKKQKKKKKKKGRDSDSSDNEGDLVNKYLSILTQKQKSGGPGDGQKQHGDKHKGKNGRDNRGNRPQIGDKNEASYGRDQSYDKNRDTRSGEIFRDNRSHDRGRGRQAADRNRDNWSGDRSKDSRSHDRSRDDRPYGRGRGGSRGQGRDRFDRDRGKQNHSSERELSYGRDRDSSVSRVKESKHERQDSYSDTDRRDKRRDSTGRRHDSPLLKKTKLKQRDNSESDRSGSEERQRSRGGGSDEDISQKVYGLIKSVRHNTAPSVPPSATKSDKSKDARRARSSSSSSSSGSSSLSRSRSRSPPKKSKPGRQQTQPQQRSRSPVITKRVQTPPRRRSRSPPRKKLTAEEREEKLREMMDNAKWREEMRTKNVQRYKQEDVREADRLKAHRGDPDFISSMVVDHVSSSTVEDRLKRNKYNIQRTRAALDKNFTQQ